MAKTSVYLPDDLAEQVRAHAIPVSEVAQRALWQAVREAQIREDPMTDAEAVAERLNATRTAAAASKQAEAGRIRELGREWGRKSATAEDLEYVANWAAGDYHLPFSLISFMGGPGRHRLPSNPKTPHWADFQAGACEVWESVKPFL